MSVLLGPSSVEQHVSTQARDEVLWEMQRCNAFAVEFHRWRDDRLARRSYHLDSILNTFSQFLLHRNRIERDRPDQRAATSRTL